MSMRYSASAVLALALLSSVPIKAQDNAVDQFFKEFTDRWVRRNPDQATSKARSIATIGFPSSNSGVRMWSS